MPLCLEKRSHLVIPRVIERLIHRKEAQGSAGYTCQMLTVELAVQIQSEDIIRLYAKAALCQEMLHVRAGKLKYDLEIQGVFLSLDQREAKVGHHSREHVSVREL